MGSASGKHFDWAKYRERRLTKIKELFSEELNVDKGLGHILMDTKGRIVTDRDGWVMFWLNADKAKKDAEHLSKRLGVDLKVKSHSWEFWKGHQISSTSRIEV